MILEDTYFEVKNATGIVGPSGCRPLVYRLMYLLTKLVLKNKFVKMLRIFYMEIDIL